MMQTSDPSRARVESVVRALHSRFGPSVDVADIEAQVEIEIDSYATARVTAFIPILVEREVHERLRTTPPALTS